MSLATMAPLGIEHKLTGARMKGTVSVHVGADNWGRRTVRFGPSNYCDDVAEEITINGRAYRISGRIVETDIGKWEFPVSGDVIRRQGRVVGGERGGVTPAAIRAIKEEITKHAPRYAEQAEGARDDAVQADYQQWATGHARLAADLMITANAIARRGQVAADVADGLLEVRPRTSNRHQVTFGPDGGLSGVSLAYDSIQGAWAPVVADIEGPDGETVAYLVIHDRRRVIVPADEVTDERWT